MNQGSPCLTMQEWYDERIISQRSSIRRKSWMNLYFWYQMRENNNNNNKTVNILTIYLSFSFQMCCPCICCRNCILLSVLGCQNPRQWNYIRPFGIWQCTWVTFSSLPINVAINHFVEKFFIPICWNLSPFFGDQFFFSHICALFLYWNQA